MELGLPLEHDAVTTGLPADDRAPQRACPRTSAPTSAPGTSAAGAPAQIPASQKRYDRSRDLPGLLPLWPSEIADATEAGRHRIVQKLRRALREERRRGLAGHWAYNLTRHAALLRALQSEMAPADRCSTRLIR